MQSNVARIPYIYIYKTFAVTKFSVLFLFLFLVFNFPNQSFLFLQWNSVWCDVFKHSPFTVHAWPFFFSFHSLTLAFAQFASCFMSTLLFYKRRKVHLIYSESWKNEMNFLLQNTFIWRIIIVSHIHMWDYVVQVYKHHLWFFF